MTRLEIESWVLRTVDRIKSGEPHEDSLVECKSEWIPPQKAARRIAAHANAALGQPILWIIGVDPSQGITGASNKELSNWWSAVQSEFNEIPPSMTDLAVPFDAKTVVALVFSTDRAPFVVKAQDGFLEVPWREGTRTNSARRSDLVRLLAPVARLPGFEVLGATLKIYDSNIPNYPHRVKASMDCYILPKDAMRVVFPLHYVRFEIHTKDRPIGFGSIRFRLATSSAAAARGLGQSSATLQVSTSELIADGPGLFSLYAEGNYSDFPRWDDWQNVLLSAELRPVGSTHSSLLQAQLPRYQATDCLGAWSGGAQSTPVRSL